MNDRPVALVTGARRGIGRAIALALGAAGFDVALADLEAGDELNAAAAAVTRCGARVVPLAADIADLSAHAALLDKAEVELGLLDCLVNNAGVSVLSRGDLLDVSPASYDRCQNVNTRGTFFLTQAVARRMLSRESRSASHRSIVTITSSNAVAASLLRGEYCVSKSALSMAATLFALRLAPHGIGVYEIQPGFIATEMTAPSRENAMTSRWRPA